MIYTQHSFSTFCDAFYKMGRSNHFSYAAKQALFDYLEELSDGDDMELDVIALCCEYSEYDPEQIVKEFSDEDYSEQDLDTILERLEHRAIIIKCDNGNYIIGKV